MDDRCHQASNFVTEQWDRLVQKWVVRLMARRNDLRFAYQSTSSLQSNKCYVFLPNTVWSVVCLFANCRCWWKENAYTWDTPNLTSTFTVLQFRPRLELTGWSCLFASNAYYVGLLIQDSELCDPYNGNKCSIAAPFMLVHNVINKRVITMYNFPSDPHRLTAGKTLCDSHCRSQVNGPDGFT